MAAVLPQCLRLTHLDLLCNNIGPAGAEALAAVLPRCRRLIHLELPENNITKEALTAIARAQAAGRMRERAEMLFRRGAAPTKPLGEWWIRNAEK